MTKQAYEKIAEGLEEAVEMEKARGREEWVQGLPRSRYYPGMEKDYEVYFSPGGAIWHKRKLSTLSASEKEG